MPVYEYECAQCGARSEIVEQLGAGRIPVRKCGVCGGTRLKKMASKIIYHPEVTLEDLGVNVIRQPAPSPQCEGTVIGPPGGKCPYCDSDISETDGNKK
ncbi:MAG TPA: zinc ribbon domain-containing protein [bacterium]|nr:zinc ribbon domain-containing protein [bacterium]